MSSSLFAGSTVGCVNFFLLRQRRAQNFHVRFFLGTFLVESIITALARFQLRRLKNVFKKSNSNSADLYAHYSSSQGRHLVLLIASIAHAMYFVMMGSRSGFPVMFLAYVVSAFARALLAG
jgi:DMSO reductase anchor subunit